MKSFQFFKIYQRFDKEKEKALIQHSIRKEKQIKLVLCSITTARNGKLQHLFQK